MNEIQIKCIFSSSRLTIPQAESVHPSPRQLWPPSQCTKQASGRLTQETARLPADGNIHFISLPFYFNPPTAKLSSHAGASAAPWLQSWNELPGSATLSSPVSVWAAPRMTFTVTQLRCTVSVLFRGERSSVWFNNLVHLSWKGGIPSVFDGLSSLFVWFWE